jgi:hypothetical protein
MPRSVDEGFRDFLQRLTPSSVESRNASNHRSSIESCLKANFGMTRFFRSGSFGNGTSISGYSDVDCFAEIPSHNMSVNSSTALSQVRTSLNNRFHATNVFTDCPAVVCPFGTDAKESTEIVPAKYLRNLKDTAYKVYEIADCAGGWMQASPDAHNDYVRYVDQKLEGKLKPLIRFVKAWKYFRSVPISSFYLELRVAKYAESESSIVYDIDVQRIFAKLCENTLAKMQDPMGISGYISPCKTQSQFQDTLSKLRTAHTRATNAVNVREAGKVSEAFDYWNLLYDNNFPRYYR